MKQVKIYTLDYCPFCKKAKAILRNKNIPFEDIDVTPDEENHTKKIAEQYKIEGEVTFPQIIIGQNRIGGCSDLEQLVANNRLEDLLNEG